MSRCAVAFVLFAAATWPAAGHEAEISPQRRATFMEVLERLRGTLRSGRLTATQAAGFDLEEFDTHDLQHLVDAVENLTESRRERDALTQVCRMVVHRRSPLGQLKKAPDICFLLAGTRENDWTKAYRLLRREPLGDALDRAVIALGRDARPQIRLIAIKHATTLAFFGRKSEGLVGTVLAGITDRDPLVAASSAWDAGETGDKRVLDRMVANLSDARAFDPQSFSVQSLQGWRNVKDVLACRFSWMVWKERCARLSLGAPEPGQMDWTPAPLTVDYIDLSPADIRNWWKKERAAFGFGAPAPMWTRVFDKVVVLKAGRPVTVRLDTGTPLRITLNKYTESWELRRPVTSVEAEVTDVSFPRHERHVAFLGNPDAPDWQVGRGRTSWSDGGSLQWRAAFLPTQRPGTVRMKLVIHLEHG